MFIAVIGVNHRSAPVDIRERLAFSEKNIGESIHKLINCEGIEGCLILSTCNRTEVYITSIAWEKGKKALWDFWAAKSGFSADFIDSYTFCYSNKDAIHHLFMVASGLDSMVLGETQILGQVKTAYELALSAGGTNVMLNLLFQQAISVGKRVRTETAIDQSPVSIPYIAVKMIKEKLGSLAGRSVLVVGAGKMSELTILNLKAAGINSVIVSNRSFDRASFLAQDINGIAVPFDKLYEYMVETDIVISGTSAQHGVMKASDIENVMLKRRGKPLLLADIAVPRDIDPEARHIKGVTLYDIDDLEGVAAVCHEEKRQAALKGKKIILEECEEYRNRMATQAVVPTIRALKELGQEIKEQELELAFQKLKRFDDKEKKIIKGMAASIVNKILCRPVVNLKQNVLLTEGHLYARVVQNIFGLEGIHCADTLEYFDMEKPVI